MENWWAAMRPDYRCLRSSELEAAINWRNRGSSCSGSNFGSLRCIRRCARGTGCAPGRRSPARAPQPRPGVKPRPPPGALRRRTTPERRDPSAPLAPVRLPCPRHGDPAPQALEEPLGSERGAQLRAQDLHGDGTSMGEILGEVHRSHPSPAELALDTVPAGEAGPEAIDDVGQGKSRTC